MNTLIFLSEKIKEILSLYSLEGLSFLVLGDRHTIVPMQTLALAQDERVGIRDPTEPELVFI